MSGQLKLPFAALEDPVRAFIRKDSGALGLDAFERGARPWQPLCTLNARLWFHRVALAGEGVKGVGVANRGCLNGPMNADEAAAVLNEAVRIGWIEPVSPKTLMRHGAEDLTFARWRATPALRTLFGLKPLEPAPVVAGAKPRPAAARGRLPPKT